MAHSLWLMVVSPITGYRELRVVFKGLRKTKRFRPGRRARMGRGGNSIGAGAARDAMRLSCCSKKRLCGWGTGRGERLKITYPLILMCLHRREVIWK